MANIYIEDTPQKTLISFAQSRLSEIPVEIKALEDEITMLEGLLEVLPPCKHCKGRGVYRDIRHHERIDNGMVECPECKGTGLTPKREEKE